MDGTPQLLTNIQFAEAKKGYDRDQVDNFLRELSVKIGELQDMLRAATTRAEAAEAKATEAAKAQVLAETIAEKAKADAAKALADAEAAPAAAPVLNEVEAASGMLALAQKTADAAVAEAEVKAKDTIADARAKAAMIIVEVEQDIERIKAEAIAAADAMVAERSVALEHEVERLSVQRDGLQAEADTLQGQVDDHRRRLREGLAALTKLLEDSGPPDPSDGGGPGSSTGEDAAAPSEPGSGAAAPDPVAQVEDADVSVPPSAHQATEPSASASPVDAESAAPSPEPVPEPVAVPVIEFVPEPTPSARPLATPLAAPLRASAPPTLASVPPRVETDDAAPSPATARAVERHPTAELKIVTLDDLDHAPEPVPSEAGAGTPAEAKAVEPAKNVEPPTVEPGDVQGAAAKRQSDPEAEQRAVQVANLLEGPAVAPVSDAPIVSEAPAPAAAVASSESAPTAPAAGAEPEPAPAVSPAAAPALAPVTAEQPAVVQPPAEITPVVIAATGTDGPRSGVSAPSGLFSAPAPVRTPSIDLAGTTLFGEPSTGVDEPTQAFDVLAGDQPEPQLNLARSAPGPAAGPGSPLGEPDADADAAMRAFFEQDLETLDKEPKSGRFLRRK